MKNTEELSCVTKLRLARAWMAEHGFSPYLYDGWGSGCFIGAIAAVTGGRDLTDELKFVRRHLAKQSLFTKLFWAKTPSFAPSYLIEHKFDTKKALAVFDAAIADAEDAEQETVVNA